MWQITDMPTQKFGSGDYIGWLRWGATHVKVQISSVGITDDAARLIIQNLAGIITDFALDQTLAPECDCPAVSSTSESPLMHAAEKASREVDGWSDSKRQYAERATGISSPNAVTIAAMEDAGEITDTHPSACSSTDGGSR